MLMSDRSSLVLNSKIFHYIFIFRIERMLFENVTTTRDLDKELRINREFASRLPLLAQLDKT